jgi:hypothetical protein
MKFLPLLIFLFFSAEIFAQTAKISGVILDEKKNPVESAQIERSDKKAVVFSDKNGAFSLEIPAKTHVKLTFSHLAFVAQELTFTLEAGESKNINILLKYADKTIGEVRVTGKNAEDEAIREQASTIEIDIKSLAQVPVPMGEFNQMLMSVGMGIVTNSELSSAYSVRGGNFDENLVYVNGMEVYRPFLVRAGQQEGLSFINPDLVKSIEFSAGGWQAKYGDKLSSVLNIEYKKPEKNAASASLGLLGGTMHYETKKGKVSFIGGLRHRDGRYLFRTMEVNGQYFPVFTDFQSYTTVDLTPKGKEENRTELGILLSYARNRYFILPRSRQTTFGTFNQQLRLYVGYTGQESMFYDTWQAGVNLSKKYGSKFRTTWTFSALKTSERENMDVDAAYRLCEVDRNLASDNFNKCALERGAASEFRYARNALDAKIFALRQQNSWNVSERTQMQFGVQFSAESISDNLYEYTILDSAKFSELTYFLEANARLQSVRSAFFVQNSHSLSEKSSLTYGIRGTYWSLNKQFLLSPRLQYSHKPDWQKDIRFNFATGIYHQPPFYREMRNFEGKLNTDLKAQSSAHFIAGMDWNFKYWERPFKFISEVYYKHFWNVVAYDVDNVRLRYYADNSTKAYAYGADFRLSGEFIKGTESWFSLSYLQIREDVNFDERGFIRRPTDQRVTATMFFEDHFVKNPTVRINLRFLFGSGLPFSPPGSPNFRSALKAPPYRRVDVGFSKIILFAEKPEKKLRPQSLWLGLEVLNLLGVENVVSYSWAYDFVNDAQFAVPNSLSQRFLNIRAILKW